MDINVSSPSNVSGASSEIERPLVYIVDDEESIRQSLGSLMRSVGLDAQTFACSQEFHVFPKRDVPSCLLLDVRLRGENGLTIQAALARSNIGIPVVIMTGYGDIAMTVKAMKAGAHDFITKPFRDQDMLDAVTSALALDRERLAAEQSVAGLRARYASLTRREREVIALVVAGLMNKQIAFELHLSEITVKVHRAQAMKKMAAGSLADLVRKAQAIGIFPTAAGSVHHGHGWNVDSFTTDS